MNIPQPIVEAMRESRGLYFVIEEFDEKFHVEILVRLNPMKYQSLARFSFDYVALSDLSPGIVKEIALNWIDKAVRKWEAE